MLLVLIIAGLVLLLAGPGWFAGAVTVGTILLIVGAIWAVLQILAYRKASKFVGSVHSRIHGDSRPGGNW